MPAADLPLSLYVHIPWCVHKCPYCDFNSHVADGPLDEDAYVSVLLEDLRQETALAGGRTLDSIFFGGGTPSLFSAQAIARIIDGVQKAFRLDEDIEITLEANPGTLEAGRYRDYRLAGVNRLSVGVQSLDDTKLRALGRIHSAAQARAAVESARQAGFDNLNLDLMFGLPQQTAGQALDDLRQLVELQPGHLSWYQLTLEPNTLFYQQPPPLPDDDALWEMMCEGKALLVDSGYGQYEISAHAQAGKACRHNLNYWRFGDYLGIGAGAHAKLTTPDGRIFRRSKKRHPKDYLQGEFLSRQRELCAAELPVEFMLNALRLHEGVPAAFFHQRTGLLLDTIARPLQRALELQLMRDDPTRLQPTARGLQFLNELLILFEV